VGKCKGFKKSEYSSLLAEAAFHANAGVLQELDQPFFGFFPLLHLVLEHLLDSVVYFVDHAT